MRFSSLAVIALGLLLANGAVAAPPAFEEADLTAKPSDADVKGVFPQNLRRQNILGRVTLRCTIDAAGKPQRCETLKEAPYGLGFGQAATGLMKRKGKFKPRRIDGRPVDGGQVEFSLYMWGRAGGAILVDDPVWASVPSFEDMAIAWPADQSGQETVVVLRCSIRRSGELKSCLVINDAGKAPAEAARTLSERFRIRTVAEGARRAIGSDVIISLRLLNPAGLAAAERRVTAPDWITYPDERALQAAYPAQATRAGVRSGRGVADCLVSSDGSLTDCRVAGEKPEGLGFGEASVSVASQMKLSLWSADGRPTAGGRIRLPVEFKPAEPAK